MPHGLNRFDAVYVINLRHRPDRLRGITAQLKSTNLDQDKIHIIDAVHTPGVGHLGCAMSHVLALEAFLRSSEDAQSCIVFEDDFEFTVDQGAVNRCVDDFFTHVGDAYDVLMLSANVMADRATEHPWLRRIVEAQTLSGYCFTRAFAPTLLENFRASQRMLAELGVRHWHCIDQHMKVLQPHSRWFRFSPVLGKQCVSFSDIENRVVDYKV
jgi:GR25 family glycosyltransferase involved in LPS biosynthesis